MRNGSMRLLPNLPSFFLAALGSIILAWVGWLTWHDITWWGKDIGLIFFGSRTGEAISLGIGMKVIHYLLMGLAFLVSGLLTFLRKRSEAVKLHLSCLLPRIQRMNKKLRKETETVDFTQKEREKPKLTIKTSNPETTVLKEVPEMPEALPEVSERAEGPEIVKEEQPPTPPKHPQARPPKCPHFFGYLKGIPKNTLLPDECLICPRMVECLYYDIAS